MRCGTVVRWLPRRGARVRRKHEAACSGVCCAAPRHERPVATAHVTLITRASTCHDSQELEPGVGLEPELGLGPHLLAPVHSRWRRVLVLQLTRRQHRQDVRECSVLCLWSCAPSPLTLYRLHCAVFSWA